MMNAGRWYPTNTTLANGDVLVVSGDIDKSQINTLPQIWRSSGGGWRDLTTAQLALPLYPFMFLAPDGRVFQAGPNQNTRYLDTSGTGSWSAVANNNHGYRDYGSAVLYDQGKVLIAGGGDPPMNSAEVIDLSAATPAWRLVSPMTHHRRQLNLTLLPDGKVLATGGSSGNGFDNAAGAVYPAEMWDPATETWSTLASFTKYRGYHSVALLLPDGRVLSAGGDASMSAEVFSPPYLFKGARPSITSAPAAVNYGQSFLVATPDGARVASVTLLRLSSVTHAFNMEQRINRLPFSAVTDGLTVTAPLSANLAPPGHYMLFVLDGNGVPSVARIVRVDVAPISIPAAPTGLAALGVSNTQIDLTWTDGSTDEDGFRIERCQGEACTDFTQVAQVNAGVVVYSDTGLSAATVYRYRMRSFNASGNSAYSEIANGTTNSAPASLPAPSGLTAAAGDGLVTLTWTAVVDATSYNVKVHTVSGGPYVTRATGVQTPSYVDSGLTNGQTYFYVVSAQNAIEESANSNEVPATPAAATATVTAWWPTEGAQLSGLHLFKALVENMPLTNYKMYWQVDGDRLNAMTDSNVDAPHKEAYVDVTTWNWRGQGPYAINFVAQNLSDQTFAEKLVNIYVVNTPAAPTNLVATAVSSSRIDLAWQDNSSNESKFKIERCSGANCSSFVQVAEVGANVTSYINWGLTSGTTYTYRVRAANTNGNSSYSNVAAATALSLPAAPSALTATPGPGSQEITLAWLDNSGNETGFKIDRCAGAFCKKFSQIAQVGADVTTFRDTGRTTGTTYRYRVRAYNVVGNSAYSAIAAATAP